MFGLLGDIPTITGLFSDSRSLIISNVPLVAVAVRAIKETLLETMLRNSLKLP